jgi:hypothetical protein
MVLQDHHEMHRLSTVTSGVVNIVAYDVLATLIVIDLIHFLLEKNRVLVLVGLQVECVRGFKTVSNVAVVHVKYRRLGQRAG